MIVTLNSFSPEKYIFFKINFGIFLKEKGFFFEKNGIDIEFCILKDL